MLVLFDQGTPVPIRPFLVGHTVKTAAAQGWSTLSNGNLMNAAEGAGFEILVTTWCSSGTTITSIRAGTWDQVRAVRS